MYYMQYSQSLERLRKILNELREQCPWDKKQTIHTLRQQTLEEVYELTDAITNEDWTGLKEELGDMLLHIVFYSRIGKEQGKFDLEDVIEGVCNKLVSRHPHIYSTLTVSGEAEVKQNWERLKQQEGKKSILSGVPPTMPALMKALRLQEKTKQVGFEWDNTAQVKAKVDEEIQELYEAVDSGNQNDIEDEMGDVLFALINYARFVKVEELAALSGRTLYDMNLQEMDELWNEVKAEERR
jgi:MazG family protein